MSETVTRVVKLQSHVSAQDGTFSEGETDTGFKFVTVEKPWKDNLPNVSCVPRPARYVCRWSWSEKHKRNLYHLIDVPERSGCEIHAANVHFQLQGCIAPGARFVSFNKDSISKGMPPVKASGVLASAATLDAFHAAMKNAVTGEQDPFILEIENV